MTAGGETPKPMWIPRKNLDGIRSACGLTVCRPCSLYWLRPWACSTSQDLPYSASNTEVTACAAVSFFYTCHCRHCAHCHGASRRIFSEQMTHSASFMEPATRQHFSLIHRSFLNRQFHRPICSADVSLRHPHALLPRLPGPIPRLRNHRHVEDIAHLQGQLTVTVHSLHSRSPCKHAAPRSPYCNIQVQIFSHSFSFQ